MPFGILSLCVYIVIKIECFRAEHHTHVGLVILALDRDVI